MALSKFPAAANDVIDNLVTTADLLRTIRDGSGSIPIQNFDTLQRYFIVLDVNFEKAKTEAVKQQTAAETYISNMGGPATLAAFQQAYNAIDSDITAWNNFFSAELATANATDYVSLQTLSFGGGSGPMIVRGSVIPSTQSANIRASSELANLISSFEALGAT